MYSIDNEQGSFAYTYSAKEQAEIKRIREKYTAPKDTEDKMARLRRLDASVTSIAQMVSLALGIIGSLIFGFGMSLILTNFSTILGWHKVAGIIVGVFAGLIGGALASLAYPAHVIIIRERRKKLAPEIIRLTDELMK